MGINEQQLDRDRYSLNFVAESVSRVLSFVGALVSTVILWRSISAGLWTSDEYGIIKVLSNANQALLPLVLLGITSAIIRTTAEYSNSREKIGNVIGLSTLIVTITFIVTCLVTVLFGIDSILLESASDSGVSSTNLKIYWLIVLLTMLPTAYMRISKSVFSGLQQNKRTTYIDIVYNITRITVLILLFVTGAIQIFSILLLNLSLAVLASILAFGQLYVQMKRKGIIWNFKPNREILRKLGRLASVGLATSLVLAVMNNVTVLWMNFYGTLTDVGLFSIAQGITLTARMVLAAPIAAMTPNLAFDFERGRINEVSRKFREVCNMTVPTYSFIFAAILAFATPILRVLYGADSVAATLFLQVLAFNLIVIITPGIYTNLFLAFDNVRAMLYANTLQVIMTILWVVIFTPIIGVIAIALIWVVYIPYFVIVHIYSKRRHKLTMNLPKMIGSMMLGLIFAGIMYLFQEFMFPVVELLGLIDFVNAMIVGLLVIPFWYLFIAVAAVVRLVNARDIANIESVLKIIPPAWWISKPIMSRIAKLAASRDTQQD